MMGIHAEELWHWLVCCLHPCAALVATADAEFLRPCLPTMGRELGTCGQGREWASAGQNAFSLLMLSVGDGCSIQIWKEYDERLVDKTYP